MRENGDTESESDGKNELAVFLSQNEQFVKQPYSKTNMHIYGTSETSSYIRMSMAVGRYPQTVRNKDTGLRQLRESGSPMIAMMNLDLNNQVTDVWPDRIVRSDPEIRAMPEVGLLSSRKLVRAAKALYEKAGPTIFRT